MARNIELLLLQTVENLGIIGDVVRVKSGYARNYLCPHGLAVPPSPGKIEALKEARAKAEAEMAVVRANREQLIERLTDVTVTIERSCNDQGALYGSVTQRDITDCLIEQGYGVDVKSIRQSHPIRRIGTYPVAIQFDKDLRVEVTLIVNPDRELEDLHPEPEAEAKGTPDTATATEDQPPEAQTKRPKRSDKVSAQAAASEP